MYFLPTHRYTCLLKPVLENLNRVFSQHRQETTAQVVQ
jgi:hypothetical protein